MKLSDAHPTKQVLEAGDRILVRLSRNLDDQQYRNVCDAVRKFAQADVAVLIANPLAIRIEVITFEPDGPLIRKLVHSSHINLRDKESGSLANLDCSPVKFEEGERVMVYLLFPPSGAIQVKKIKQWIERWIGDDGVEVRVQCVAEGLRGGHRGR